MLFSLSVPDQLSIHLFLSNEGVLLCNTYSREICLLIKMLQIVFRSLRRLSILCIGNNVSFSVRYWSEEGNKGCFGEKNWICVMRECVPDYSEVNHWQMSHRGRKKWKRRLLFEKPIPHLDTCWVHTIHQIHCFCLDFTFKGGNTLARVYMWFCTCKLILNWGVWIIYLATIQLGMSLVFTFYHQGHWMSPRSNLTHDTSSVLVPFLHDQRSNRLDQENVSVAWMYFYTPRKQKVDEQAGWWLSVAVVKITQRSAVVAVKHDGRSQGLASPSGSDVHSREFEPPSNNYEGNWISGNVRFLVH